jgi:hypothetical protein
VSSEYARDANAAHDFCTLACKAAARSGESIVSCYRAYWADGWCTAGDRACAEAESSRRYEGLKKFCVDGSPMPRDGDIPPPYESVPWSVPPGEGVVVCNFR